MTQSNAPTIIAFVWMIGRKIYVDDGNKTKTLADTAEGIEFLAGQSDPYKTVILSIMGTGQSLQVRALNQGFQVYRIPWFSLCELVPTLKKGASPAEEASALLAAYDRKPEAFYVFNARTRDMTILFHLSRTRNALMRYFRIPAQQIHQAAERDFDAMLPDSDTLIDLRRRFVDKSLIERIADEERALEREIERLLKKLPIYNALRGEGYPTLPAVKGFGPSIAGTILGEIGDITRFRSDANLRSYARAAPGADGEFPRRRRGEPALWNQYLTQAVWLWYSDQLARYPMPWRDLYYERKAYELRQHPEVEVVNSKADGTGRSRYLYTMGMLDQRAKRYVGTWLINYIWGLWTALEQGQDLANWYAGSRFPEIFATAARNLEANKAFIDSERIRRRGEPAGEVEDGSSAEAVTD